MPNLDELGELDDINHVLRGQVAVIIRRQKLEKRSE